jgi:hypothetical protein
MGLAARMGWFQRPGSFSHSSNMCPGKKEKNRETTGPALWKLRVSLELDKRQSK